MGRWALILDMKSCRDLEDADRDEEIGIPGVSGVQRVMVPLMVCRWHQCLNAGTELMLM